MLEWEEQANTQENKKLSSLSNLWLLNRKGNYQMTSKFLIYEFTSNSTLKPNVPTTYSPAWRQPLLLELYFKIVIISNSQNYYHVNTILVSITRNINLFQITASRPPFRLPNPTPPHNLFIFLFYFKKDHNNNYSIVLKNLLPWLTLPWDLFWSCRKELQWSHNNVYVTYHIQNLCVVVKSNVNDYIVWNNTTQQNDCLEPNRET